MPFTMNKVILIGRLGADPEFRTSPQGINVCRFRVATNERYLDRSSGTWKEETDWHTVVVFGNLAETANKLLKKGHRVGIEGRNKTRQYEKNGVTHYITEVIARSIVFLETRSERDVVDASAYDNEFADPTSFYINDIQNDTFPQEEIKTSEEEDDLPF
ncbi:MAG: single-stranded DNA-binding protein [Candidatus Kapaibacteriota bacterium]